MNTSSFTAPVLQAADVVAGYGKRPVLQGLNLAVRPGEVYALLGSNGAGKTTTLGLFLGFLAPMQGQVRVGGIDPVREARGARRQLAYIPENVALYGHLSAQENLAYLLHLAGQPATAAVIAQALTAAGLDAAAHRRRVSDFSKGMRQKVSIAVALARQVPVLLLDEPTSGLDPQASSEFNRVLAQLRSQGVATLMATHDLLSVADVADRIGFMDGGRLSHEVAAQERGGARFDVLALHRHYARRTTAQSALLEAST